MFGRVDRDPYLGRHLMDILFDIITGIFLLAGSVLILIGGYGIIKLDDVFARMHSAGMIDTLGLTLIIVGLMFQGGFTLITFKLFLIIVFVVYTSPAVTHALARAAIAGGMAPRATQVELTDRAKTGGEPSNS